MLDPQLQQDCLPIATLEVGELLLMNEQQFPWLLIVPQGEKLTEYFQLSQAQQIALSLTTNQLAECFKSFFHADKVNIANIGNVVSQLHIHIVFRKYSDSVWPKPVWGNFESKPYTKGQAQTLIESIRDSLKDNEFIKTEV